MFLQESVNRGDCISDNAMQHYPQCQGAVLALSGWMRERKGYPSPDREGRGGVEVTSPVRGGREWYPVLG